MRVLVAFVVSMACAWSPRSATAQDVPFETLGKALIEAAIENAPTTGESGPRYEQLLRVLEPLHDRVRVGAFELWVPRQVLRPDGKLENGPGPKSVRDSALRLLELQRTWLAHLDLGLDDLEPCEAASETLRRWTSTLRSSPLAAPPPEVVSARTTLERRFAARVIRPDEGFAPPDYELVLIVAPTRAHYLGLIGCAGVVWPEVRSALWQNLARRSTAASLAPEVMCVALSEGPDREESSPFENNAMESELATQTLVHMSSHLFSNRLLPSAPNWFVEGLAIVDTIELLRRDDTTCSGHRVRSDVLQQGPAGMLAFVTVDLSPYRGDEAERWFARALKPEADKPRFTIHDLDKGTPATTADAPFLAEGSSVPQSIRDGPAGVQKGFAEFFRAYCAAFVHYLDCREMAGRPLLTKLIVMAREGKNVSHLRLEMQFLGALELLTDQSLGRSDDPDADVEAAFVAWLRKAKRTE